MKITLSFLFFFFLYAMLCYARTVTAVVFVSALSKEDACAAAAGAVAPMPFATNATPAAHIALVLTFAFSPAVLHLFRLFVYLTVSP